MTIEEEAKKHYNKYAGRPLFEQPFFHDDGRAFTELQRNTTDVVTHRGFTFQKNRECTNKIKGEWIQFWVVKDAKLFELIKTKRLVFCYMYVDAVYPEEKASAANGE